MAGWGSCDQRVLREEKPPILRLVMGPGSRGERPSSSRDSIVPSRNPSMAPLFWFSWSPNINSLESREIPGLDSHLALPSHSHPLWAPLSPMMGRPPGGRGRERGQVLCGRTRGSPRYLCGQQTKLRIFHTKRVLASLEKSEVLVMLNWVLLSLSQSLPCRRHSFTHLSGAWVPRKTPQTSPP